MSATDAAARVEAYLDRREERGHRGDLLATMTWPGNEATELRAADLRELIEAARCDVTQSRTP